MDEPLIKVLKEMSPTINTINNIYKRIANFEAFVPGFATIDGKDLKQELETKGIASLLNDGIERIQFNDSIQMDNPSILKEKIYILFGKDYQEDVKQHYQHILSTIYALLSSVKDLIPNIINDSKDAMVVNNVIRFEKFIKKQLPLFNLSFSALLSLIEKLETTKETNSSLVYQEYKIILFSIMDRSISLSCLLLGVIYLHQIVYEYFYGDVKKKKDNYDLVNQIVAGVVSGISPQMNNLNKYMERNAKTTEQTQKNTEVTNNTLNEMKEKQKEAIKLIVNRNEAEKPKRLQVAKCANDICRILKNEYKMIVKQDTIEKYLHRFDDDLEMGKTIALPSYEHAMYFDKSHFIVWIREQFIPHYLEHRKIRVKNKTPRRSSSDAAFDEAARQKYKDEEEGDDNY